LLSRVRETVWTPSPIGLLSNYCRCNEPFRDLSHSPLFQVLFSLAELPGGELTFCRGLSLTPFEARRPEHFDCAIQLKKTGSKKTQLIAVEYSTDLLTSRRFGAWQGI